MRVLVTGVAGFIGFHLTKELIKMQFEVIGIDSINKHYDVNLKWDRLSLLGIDKINLERDNYYKKGKLTVYKTKLENRNKIFDIFKIEKPDAVCNLAAQAGVRYSIENPNAYIKANILGFQNVIDAIQKFKIKNFSFASSSSVYGGNIKLPFSTTDRTDSPISLYAATKKSNELISYTYSHLYKISCKGLRFFKVYGTWGRPDMALFIFADSLRKNKRVNVFNHGDMTRDFTYVDDIIKGLIK